MRSRKQTAADSAKSPYSAILFNDMEADCGGKESEEEGEERKKSVLKAGWLWQHTNTAKQWQSLWTVAWDSGRMMFWKGEDEVDLIDHLYLPMDKPVNQGWPYKGSLGRIKYP